MGRGKMWLGSWWSKARRGMFILAPEKISALFYKRCFRTVVKENIILFRRKIQFYSISSLKVHLFSLQ